MPLKNQLQGLLKLQNPYWQKCVMQIDGCSQVFFSFLFFDFSTLSKVSRDSNQPSYSKTVTPPSGKTMELFEPMYHPTTFPPLRSELAGSALLLTLLLKQRERSSFYWANFPHVSIPRYSLSTFPWCLSFKLLSITSEIFFFPEWCPPFPQLPSPPLLFSHHAAKNTKTKTWFRQVYVRTVLEGRRGRRLKHWNCR